MMNIKDFALAVLITAIWGVNFSVIKMGLESLDAFTLAGFRFLLCALPLVFFIKKPDVSIIYVAAYGLTFGVGLWGMVSLGIHFGASAGMASLILQMSAFLTVLLGVIFLGDNIDRIKILGFAIAIAGLGFIFMVADGSVTTIGLVFVLIGALAMSATNIIVKVSGAKRIFAFIIWSSLFSPIPLFLIAYFTQGQSALVSSLVNIDGKAIFSILFQVYPTTLFGYWVWNSLINKYQVSKVAPLSLLVAIFGVAGSFLIFNETIGTEKLIAIVLIMTGLFISTFSHKIKREK
ncbi:MAG: EamA family transporter [Cocleimonas sp.]